MSFSMYVHKNVLKYAFTNMVFFLLILKTFHNFKHTIINIGTFGKYIHHHDALVSFLEFLCYNKEYSYII